MGNPGHEAAFAQTGTPEQKIAKEGQSGTKKPGSKAQGRKRTKTGCLTCRQRRIKCGEERPTCQNCYKSKRQCEGYNQRVVFKDPLNAYRGPPMSSHISFSEHVPAVRQGDQFQQASAANPLLIAPKPGPLGLSIVTSDSTPGSALPSATSSGSERRAYSFLTAPEYPTLRSSVASKPQQLETNFDTIDRSHVPEPRSQRSPPQQTAHYDFDALHVKREIRDEQLTTSARTSPLDWSAGPTTSATFFQSYPTSATWQQPTPVSASAGPSFPEPNFDYKVHFTPPQAFPETFGDDQQRHRGYLSPPQGNQQQNYVIQATDWKAEEDVAMASYQHQVEDDDEDPYDVSDDDVAMEEYEHDGTWQGQLQENNLKNNDLGIVVALQAMQENQDFGIRSTTSFIDRPNMLATYTPSPQSSPLSDSMTARLFCHFIHVTGPSMSMFERHPANPSLIFQGQPVLKSQQHIWTYTFPTLAFHNQGLLHAMLALASLHIAKLQNGPITASLKHYAISLRRVAKSLSSPSRRGQPATLAASMLLAFYECWCADHQKWSNHLLGAKQLVREIDFSGMTKHIKTAKAQQRREERERNFQAQQQGARGYYEDRTRYQAIVEDVDENIVGMLMGKKLRYDQYGRVMDDVAPDHGSSRMYSHRELEIYETQRDLFWWYCKQDVYQSILGGGRLFMEYDLWSHCPPRAPLGRLNSTYGTFDHLILLMGRLADFASRDVKRKRLAMKANGGWRPPGGMAMPAPSNSYQQQQMPQVPSFSGMVPDVAPPKLPMGFEQTSRDESPQGGDSSDMDLDALRIEAEEEWQEIRNAFSILEDHFGEDFQALGSEFSKPIQTPFGTALKYRTYGIAGIWMNFYMALIACHRAHPSMPPAAMMAAGIAARQTASLATALGRIAAGIAEDCSMTNQVSPGVGAALIESATCLFVAGVQYQDAAQRAWTVNRLRDIARLTGWQTALAIATGCETSWVKTGMLGRGPIYSRSTEEREVPDIWNSSRRLDRALEDKRNDETRMVIGRSDRVHYALGILSVEEDFERLDLDNGGDGS